MREHLIQYVNLLFAGSEGTEDVKQEILQNTLDRFDDLISQGKSPESAYSLAISGIGDVSELLQGVREYRPDAENASQFAASSKESESAGKRGIIRALAIGMYIICPIPVLFLRNEMGVCLLLAIVAAATGLLIYAGRSRREPEEPETPQKKARNSIHSAVGTVGFVIYLFVSMTTDAWHITWLIFPIVGAVNGLLDAVLDLKEAD